MSPTAPRRRSDFVCSDGHQVKIRSGRLAIVCSSLLGSLAPFALDLFVTLGIRGLMGEGCCWVFFLNTEPGMEGVLQSCCCFVLKEDDLYDSWQRVRITGARGQG